jgi:hypothetical protein
VALAFSPLVSHGLAGQGKRYVTKRGAGTSFWLYRALTEFERSGETR